jgi:hypothetical protein
MELANMKRWIWWAVIILCAGLGSTWARFGETSERSTSRYGSEITVVEPDRFIRFPLEKEAVYRKDDYSIIAFYAENKVCWITYTREPMKRLENVEIQTFLKANQGEPIDKDKYNKWIPDGSGGFILQDGSAYARIDTMPVGEADVPVSVSIYSLKLFLKSGAVRPDLLPKLPAGVNAQTLKDF